MATARERLDRPRPRSLALLAFGATALLALPASASAHQTVAEAVPQNSSISSVPAPAAVRAVTGARTVTTDAGLYRVTTAVGEPVLTHGPDTRAASESRESGLAPDGTGFAAGALERQPVCASDFYQRVIYASTTTNPERIAAASAQIRTVIGRMDAVLNSESLASGGPGADYKMLCNGSGQVRVDVLTIGGASFAEVVSSARAAGFESDRASHLIFVDGALGGSCGIATYEEDARLALDNRSNAGGGYAVVYEPCWEGETAMHESAHMMGAVQYAAPNSTGTGGHCNEAADVMCYSPDGGDRNQGGLLLRCPGSPRFDCNFDDYFDSAPEPGEYLASHWNLGSPLNRFIAFAGIPAERPASSSADHGELRGGGRKRGASGEPGDWRQFKFKVNRGAEFLRLRLLAAPGADLALFARRQGMPTKEVFACRALLRARHASCRIDDPDPGVWYAGVLTRGGPIGAGYKISARVRG